MGESEDDSSTPILANNSANIGNNDSNDCEIVMSRRIHLETIEKPMITNTGSSFLREWKISRGQYEDLLKENGETANKATYKVSFEPKLLSAFCEYHWGKRPDKVTEKQIQIKITEIIKDKDGAQIYTEKGLFNLFRNIKMDIENKNCQSRIVEYMKAIRDIADKYGVDDEIFGDGQEKRRIAVYMVGLEPNVLKTAMQSKQMKDIHLTQDWEFFFKTLKEEALKWNEFMSYNNVQYNGEHNKQKVSSKKPKSTSKNHRKDYDSEKHKQYKKTSQREVKSSTFKPHPNRAEKPPFGCLKCTKDHWLDQCPDLKNDAERIKLTNDFREQREKDRAKVRHIDYGNYNPRHVVLEENIQLPVVIDSGTQYTIGPDCLKQMLPNAVVNQLEFPMTFSYFSDTNSTEAANQVITEEIIVKQMSFINKNNNPVRLGVQRIRLIKNGASEILLGNILLKSLGINVIDQMDNLNANEVHDTSEDGLSVTEIPIGKSSEESMDLELEAMLKRAADNGVPDKWKKEMRKNVFEFKNIFRSKLTKDPPVNVAPLQVRLKTDAVPYRCKPRKFSKEQRDFLAEFTAELLDAGMIIKNTKSVWASSVLPIKKPNGEGFRATIDLVKVNAMVLPLAGLMPFIHELLERITGVVGFAKYDAFKGFWQLALDKKSQEIFSFMTHEGVFTPTRVVQGSVDASLFFQSAMQECIGPNLWLKNIAAWIDDVLQWATSWESFVNIQRKFFQRMALTGMKLNVKKSELFLPEIEWCGRIISTNGIRHSTKRINAISNLPVPKMADELQQLLCGVNWMRDGLPNFSNVTAPLYAKLESVRKENGVLTSKKSKLKKLAIIFNEPENQSFRDLKELVANAVTMVPPNYDYNFCVFTDASMQGWGYIITQVAIINELLPIAEWKHEPLAFGSGVFKGSELNWSTIEQEASAIIKAVDKYRYLLEGPKGFLLFTDHKNLVYIFGERDNSGLSAKLQRWAMRLASFRYVIYHIDGDLNVWADLLSRWGISRNLSSMRIRHISYHNQNLIAGTFIWPTVAEISANQQKYNTFFKKGSTTIGKESQYRNIENELTTEENDNIGHADVDKVKNIFAANTTLLKIDGKVWIPENAKDLITRLCIIAHTGSAGHRGIGVCMAILKKLFTFKHMKDIVSDFMQKCLSCKHVKGGKIIPRPWAATIKATKSNEILNFDFLYIGPSNYGVEWIFNVGCEHSHYTILNSGKTANKETALEGLINWHSLFGLPKVWTSDNGTHFKNYLIDSLKLKLKINHNFSLAYMHWLNGTPERKNKDVLQIMRMMCIDFNMDVKEWPKLLPLVQFSLNHSPLRSLGGLAPVEVFTGLKCQSLVEDAFFEGCEIKQINEIVATDDYRENVEKLRKKIQRASRNVLLEREKQLIRNRKNHYAIECNFSEGDYVLWSRVDKVRSKHKLSCFWMGPYMVTSCLDLNIYHIKHLYEDIKKEVHGSRLKFYCDSSLLVNEDLKVFISSQDVLVAVEMIDGHRFKNGKYEFWVKWKGFDQIENSWEPYASLVDDIKVMVNNYICQSKDPELIKSLGGHCGIRH